MGTGHTSMGEYGEERLSDGQGSSGW
ncbi:uncharacterized protein FFB20_04833 [Fusarium fujikuroi]|nr:uncharacterized protein FFB20_04833 [Fusarium fujikuroi]SCN76683.1 uncharacterized protein FFE2_03601 [Fusarium fujikuroi]SCN78747.1 uncharacterized protein FFM5_01934 [Fusarium fujikuroi]SCN94955.1 uncharacterized protein FFC1_07181 [Fusarium fujikuroi]SCO33590.1 uncharacterized protein FFMR_03156 [Fusarium fujikuroi]